MSKRNRNLYNNDYVSVTQTLGVLRKIGLEFWFKFNTAKFCNEESNKGKLVGTQIHDAIEQYILNGSASVESEYAEEVNNALQSFILFKKENPEIELSMSEIRLTSEEYKYNGTIDAPNPPYLVDWKSGKAKDDPSPKIYDEYKYQVSAYVYLWNECNPDNLINQAHIVSLAKDKVGYGLYTMEEEEIKESFNEVFLSCLKILNYQEKEKKNG